MGGYTVSENQAKMNKITSAHFGGKNYHIAAYQWNTVRMYPNSLATA